MDRNEDIITTLLIGIVLVFLLLALEKI